MPQSVHSFFLTSPNTQNLSSDPGRPEQVHVFDEESVLAVNAAYSARRPLLVRGEPGVGKTQLAVAVAAATNRVLISFVVDSKTESRDLLWEYDAVLRLAEAQVMGSLKLETDEIHKRLAIRRFLRPGPLWWTFDWQSAESQAQFSNTQIPIIGAGRSPAHGVVLLIDELDKAESDVPNGLLEALGSGQFLPLGYDIPIIAHGQRPFVLITTNEERLMPDAFLRRCMVLQLRLPETEGELVSFLMSRGKAHFPKASGSLLRSAAELLSKDRRTAISSRITPLPGQAEFLDLIRAVMEIAQDEATQLDLLAKVSRFALKKTIGAAL